MAELPEYTKEELLRYGLAGIFRGLDYMGYLDKCCSNDTPLQSHPFGLPFEEAEFQHADGDGAVTLLGHPGMTDESVEGMIAHIRYVIAGQGMRTADVLKSLRVIYAQCSPENPKNHDIYYEVGSDLGTFLAGGCTDCSGAGGAGKRTLDSVFALLSSTLGIEIEKVEIPFLKAREVRNKLAFEYDARRAY